MLYILNKACASSLAQLAAIGAGDDEAWVLLVSDAVFLGTDAGLKRFADLDVESFYAARDAVEAREVALSAEVELLDYDAMAELLEDADKVIML